MQQVIQHQQQQKAFRENQLSSYFYYQHIDQQSKSSLTVLPQASMHNVMVNKADKMSTQFKSRKNIEVIECGCDCKTCLQIQKEMKEGIRLANKEIEYLRFMLNFKDIGLEKRDIMLNKYMEQMTQLHEEIKALKITNNKFQSKANMCDIVQANQKPIPSRSFNSSRRNTSSQVFKVGKGQHIQLNLQLKQQTKPQNKKLNDNNNESKDLEYSAMIQTINSNYQLPKLEIIKIEDNQPSNHINKINFNQQALIPMDQHNMADIMSPNSTKSKRSNETPRNSLSITNIQKSNQRRQSFSSHSISVQNVTNTQGRQEDDVLFRNVVETNSLMEKGEEDLLTNTKLVFLEQFFENSYKFQSQVVEMNELQQKQLLKIVNQAISDLKRFFTTSLKYKELLNVTNEMAKQTSFDHAFDLILKKICIHLKCDTASIFLVDFRSNELWTIGNKQGTTIRFPLTDNSIVGYCINHEIAMNVYDAYDDPRFNKQIDIDTGYRTKTILCVPIKDEKNQVVGCLEAINKFNEFFNKQDQEILELMGNFCSSVLRNSLKFDKLILQRDYFKKLIQIGNFIQDSTELDKMMIEAEEKLRELIGSDQCYIYILQKENDKINLVRYIKESDQPHLMRNITSSIVYQVIKSLKIQSDQIPQENINYDDTIDIKTSLPLVTVPIFNKDYSRIVGVFQAENVKGFLQKHFGKDEDFQNSPESLYLYGEMIGNAILKHKFYQEKIDKYLGEVKVERRISQQRQSFV